MGAESLLRKRLAASWDGWIDWIEPGFGCSVGRPDCDIFLAGRLLPIELKIASPLTEPGWFRVSKMRPAQVGWHRRFRDAGGTSLWLMSDGEFHWLAHNIIISSPPHYCFETVKLIDMLDLRGAVSTLGVGVGSAGHSFGP